MDRKLFAEIALSYVPHALTLIDRNPYSPTYGCCDREYWHYRTLDFPCGMAQEHVLTLAMLYVTDMPGNKWYKCERIKELAIAAMRFAIKGSHKDGTCDDYFPYERAMGALAFSTYAIAEGYQLLDVADEEVFGLLRKRADHLLSHNETGQLSNHQALAALVLQTVYEVTGDERYKVGAKERAELTLSWQNVEEGWFQEYEGADCGYLTCTIDFLGKYYKKSGDESVVMPLKKAVAFSRNFMHPDGSYGGEYNSRNTYHYYPHGFEIMAESCPAAAWMNDRWLEGSAKGKRYFNDDSRMIGHLIHNMMAAYRDYCEKRPEVDEYKLTDGVRWLGGAEMVVANCGGYHAVAGMRKGGVIKVYDNEKCIYSDTGLIGKAADGAVLISHLQDEQNVITADEPAGVFTVKGCFSKRKSKLADPTKLIIFRMLNMTLGRFAPNLLRSLLQKILITGKNRTPFWFERKIVFADDKVTIEDTVDPKAGFVSLSVGSDATSIYVAASNVYQDSVMLDWQNASAEVCKGETWKRIIQAEGRGQ